MTYGNIKTACGTYKKNDITNLTPVQVVSRLYDALEQDILLAKEAISQDNHGCKGERISHALAIIGELQANLDLDEGGEIASNLNLLYDYLTVEISKANVTNNNQGLINAMQTVKPLCEAWSELANHKPENVRPVVAAGRPMAVAGAVAFNATF